MLETKEAEAVATSALQNLYKSRSSCLGNGLLIVTACFALIWIVHRALVQSITLDEANTFRYFVAPDVPTHWEPNSNNHVLNSMLMRFFVWLFGLSHLTVRAPALLGGVCYILVVYRFCALISQDLVLRWALFVCFVYNPFVMDYLVAARGYGLALGFFSVAIYLVARTLIHREELHEQEMVKYAAAVSACTAFSFCANFSFAYANAFLLLVAFFVWSRLLKPMRAMKSSARLALPWALPAFLIVLIFAGSVVAAFPRNNLIWGTDSLTRTWVDIRDASFAELNDYLVNPLLANFLRAFRQDLLRAGARSVILYLVLVLLIRLLSRQTQSVRARQHLVLAGCLAAVLVLSLFAHWLQFKLLKIPLPFERTSLFLVVLLTAIVGVVLAVAPSNPIERAARGLGIAALCLTCFYFVGELRDSYFREWRGNADLRAAFPVIVDRCRSRGVREVASDLNYSPSLDFYRVLYKMHDLIEFPNLDRMPPGKPIYVLPENQYADFIRREGLQVAYHGRLSDLVVAVRPGE